MLIGGFLLGLAGCAHQDGVETTNQWWHNFEGGEIAKLRPPPPGQSDPYPLVSKTPTQEPDLPSPAARELQTQQLEMDRNLAQRVSAAQGPLPVVPKTAPPAPVFTPNNATMGAADDKNTVPNSAPAPVASSKAAPELAMPQLVTKKTVTSGSLPDMPSAPPAPISFAGFAVPATASSASSLVPDIDASTPEGTLIRFQVATDQTVGDAVASYRRIAGQRGGKRVKILGFGAAMSADAGLAPADQVREVSLGLLRAQTVARGLVAQGVPQSMIDLQGAAIGDGVRVRITK
ncbi:hypothetical protein AA106555_1468 [Neokomagataea thailandica NBRC 106555]|uniref:OmpA-like domain-containing protein n=3 Tax=Acetobacteraceae TaxID=433 RepID=A0A4Y6V871_9PROT|nr:hypothetical protein D5366_04920 [Neokomagataea tanensis]GBR53860.1 hypothetical protein AA106555_1468 [Neokomagataea thailandica NBRC 106555]